jgi:hypothetical protein
MFCFVLCVIVTLPEWYCLHAHKQCCSHQIRLIHNLPSFHGSVLQKIPQNMKPLSWCPHSTFVRLLMGLCIVLDTCQMCWIFYLPSKWNNMFGLCKYKILVLWWIYSFLTLFIYHKQEKMLINYLCITLDVPTCLNVQFVVRRENNRWDCQRY